MDFSGNETYDDCDDVRDGVKRGCLGWLFRAAAVSVGVVLLLTSLLAFLLTTDFGRLWLLSEINSVIAPAELAVHDWDAGFFGPLCLHGVEYRAPDEGLRVDVESVIFAKGIFALVPVGKLSLGEIVLESPEVSCDFHEAKTDKSKSGNADASDGRAFFMPAVDIGGTLLLKNGTLMVMYNGRTLLKSHNLHGRLVLDSFWKPFGFNISGAAGKGTIGLTASLQSINSLINGGDSEYADKVVLQLDKINLADLAAVLELGGFPVLPSAGIAEGAVTVERSGGIKTLDVEGGLLIEKMQVKSAGGKLSPAGDVALLVDAGIKDDLCVFRKCELSSPWGQISLRGSLKQIYALRKLSGDIEADIDMDIAATVRDFRDLLPVNDDLHVSGGTLSGSFMVKDFSGGKRFETSLQTSDLSMRYREIPLSLKQDTSLLLKVRVPDDALSEIEELRLQASFADIYGKGNIRQGVVKGYVDLSRFYEDFGGVFKSGFASGGAVNFNLSTRPSGDSSFLDCIAKFTRLNVTSAGAGASSVKEGSFTFKGLVDGVGKAADTSDVSLRDVEYDLRLNQSRLHGAAKRLVPVQDGADLPVLRGFSMNADVWINDLIRAGGLLMKRPAYMNALDSHGAVVLNSAVECANNVAKMRVNGVGENIVVNMAGQKISEPEMLFQGSAVYDAGKGGLSLKDVRINSGFIDLEIPDWFVGLSEDGEGVKFKGNADALLDMRVLSSFFSSDANTCNRMRGDAGIALDAEGDDSGSEMNVNVILSDFYVFADKEICFHEKQAEMNLHLFVRENGRDALVRSLKFDSSLIDISADGSVNDFLNDRNADLHGETEIDFGAVNRLLRVRGIDEWTLSGRRKSSFELKGPLTGDFTQKGFFAGSAYLASLKGLGLSAGGAEIALEMKNRSLQCDWQPVLNGGRLKFSPVLEFTPRGISLMFPEKLEMLKKVKITQDMVDKLLVNCNPMFQDSRVHRGTAGFRMNSFVSGPKTGHEDLYMDADIVLENVSMTLSPVMRNLLSMINVKTSVYRVEHLPMHVIIRKERIYLEPMTMVFSGQPVIFSGSAGFDSTIDYLIEIPLGDTIVRKTGLNLPGNLTVKVPVTGTVDNPRLATGALEKAFGGFIKNTLGDDALKGVGNFLEELKKELE
ncbi:MAG: hypothetical protein R6V06_07485 [Kiritimatiellia bacterium]